MPVNVSICEAAAAFANEPHILVSVAIEILVCLSTIFLLLHILWSRPYKKVAIHPNLKVLLVNVLVVYAATSLDIVIGYGWQLIIYFTYQDACSIVFPAWFVTVERGISFVYNISFPEWHLVISIERIWATLRPKEYENKGATYGIVAAIVVWALMIAHVGYLIIMAYQDEGFRSGSAYIALVTKTNAEAVQMTQYVVLVIDLLSLIIDSVVAIINRRRMRKIGTGYSLAKNYQINENVAVTLRLILPLDVVNAGLFIVCTVIALIFRPYRYEMGLTKYQAIIEYSASLTWLQSPLSLLIFMYFCKSSKKKPVLEDHQALTDRYFELFDQQIGAARTPL